MSARETRKTPTNDYSLNRARQVLNRRDGSAFSREDERSFEEFIASVGVVLEAWRRMRESERSTLRSLE